MKYILPLKKEREKYHFEISNDGKELIKNNIIPIINTDNKLENGLVYVESQFQNDKYFELTKFNELSLDKWKEILKELSSKIGATKIRTTLKSEKENGKTTNRKNNVNGNCKASDIETSIINNSTLDENSMDILKSTLEFELELKGKKQSLEEVDKWIEDEKINLIDNYIFRTLIDNFKCDNLRSYTETIKFEQILKGITEVNNTFEAIAKIKSSFFNISMNASLSNISNEEFKMYEKKELTLEIIF
jgi:hypothetical protein